MSTAAFTALGLNAPVTYSVTGGTLPAGLTINSGTGVISGSPTTIGSTVLTVTAASGTSRSTATVNISVTAGASITPTPQTLNAVAGITITPTAGFTANNFSTAPTYSITVGNLPAGLSMASDTGVITGSTIVVGSTSITVSATDGTYTATGTINITVTDPGVASITPTPQTLNAVAGTTITPTAGFTANYFFSAPLFTITSGTLPAGLAIASDTGVISGSTTVVGSTSVTVSATDGTKTATATVNIVVSPALVASITPITSSAQTVNAVVGSLITPTSAFTETNLSGAVTYSLVSGTWPDGLSLNSSTGVVSGTPTATQASTSYTIRATDSLGATADATVNITISTTPTPPPSGALSAPTGVTVRAGAAGTAVITWNAVSGASRYTAQAFSSNTSTKIIRQCSVTATANGSSFTCTIPRLQSRLTYYVEVVVRNVSGAISTPSRIAVTVL